MGNKRSIRFRSWVGAERTQKNFLFSHLNEKLRHGSHQSILLIVVGESSHCDGNIRIQNKMAINFDASDLTL